LAEKPSETKETNFRSLLISDLMTTVERTNVL